MYYTYHKDIPNNKWNAFVVEDGHEIFVQAFDTMEEARDFCNAQNDIVEGV